MHHELVTEAVHHRPRSKCPFRHCRSLPWRRRGVRACALCRRRAALPEKSWGFHIGRSTCSLTRVRGERRCTRLSSNCNIWPISAAVAPKSGQLGPELDRFRPVSARSRASWAISTRVGASRGTSWPTLGKYARPTFKNDRCSIHSYSARAGHPCVPMRPLIWLPSGCVLPQRKAPCALKLLLSHLLNRNNSWRRPPDSASDGRTARPPDRDTTRPIAGPPHDPSPPAAPTTPNSCDGAFLLRCGCLHDIKENKGDGPSLGRRPINRTAARSMPSLREARGGRPTSLEEESAVLCHPTRQRLRHRLRRRRRITSAHTLGAAQYNKTQCMRGMPPPWRGEYPTMWFSPVRVHVVEYITARGIMQRVVWRKATP